MPKIAAEIAQRLLSAGRVEEAWQAIEAAEPRQRSRRWDWPDFTFLLGLTNEIQALLVGLVLCSSVPRSCEHTAHERPNPGRFRHP